MSTLAPLSVSTLRQEHVYLPGISYATYAALIDEVGNRRNLRFTYDQGALEIMSPS